MEKTADVLAHVPAAELERAVRAALGEQNASVEEAAYTGLSGAELAASVFGVSGTARAGGASRPFQVVLKIIRPSADGLEEQGERYWKREARMYQSGFFAELPAGLSGARCYAVVETPDEVRLWLEYLRDDYDRHWSIAQFEQAARSLGRFNGAFRTGHPFPAQAWAARGWLRGYVEHAAPMIERMRGQPQHPLVGLFFPQGTGAVLALWQERHALLDVLDALPQTFCHQDAFTGNLFLAGERLYAIDWTYMGAAPLGAEIVPLVIASIGLTAPELAERIHELDQAVFAAYLAGLREVGWAGDPRDARLAYCLTLPLRYIFGGMIGQLLPAMIDLLDAPQREERLQADLGPDSLAELQRRLRQIDVYYDAMLKEAAGLLGEREATGIDLRRAIRALEEGV